MRLVVGGLVCAFVVGALWLSRASDTGAVPMATYSPLSQQAQAPAFTGNLVDLDALQAARSAGRLKENDERRELRMALLHAANRLEKSPCDNALKLAFRKATVALIEELRATRTARLETYVVDGREIDTTDFLNRWVFAAIWKANQGGVLRPEDMRGEPITPDTDRRPADTAEHGGPYACRLG